MTEELYGTPVQIGRRTLVVPPLAIGPYRRLAPHLDAISKDPTNEEHIEAILAAAHLVITRNHPELTREDFDESVTVESLPRIVKAMLGQTEEG